MGENNNKGNLLKLDFEKKKKHPEESVTHPLLRSEDRVLLDSWGEGGAWLL